MALPPNHHIQPAKHVPAHHLNIIHASGGTAGGDRRTDYVAVSNTAIGVILLLAGSLESLASVIGPAGVVLVLSLCGIIGVVVGATLPEVE